MPWDDATALAARTWPEVDPAALLLVPLGSTEQHGPHLPISTDTDVAQVLCAGLAAARVDVLVAPALAYGSSGEHQGFPGTLSIGAEAIELVVLELGRSAFETFRRVLFVSAHGGNAEPVTRAIRQLRAESRDARVFHPRSPGDAHAGHSETSLQLAVQPSAVRTEHAVEGNIRPLTELLPAVRRGGVRAVSETGVLGDPTTASAAAGRALLDALVADLRAAAQDWFPVPVGSTQ